MNDSTRQQIWVNTWKEAAPLLRKHMQQELQASDYYEKHRHFLDDMLDYACRQKTVRPISGLVQQQQIFMMMKKQTVQI